jgi:hypothetical protein
VYESLRNSDQADSIYGRREGLNSGRVPARTKIAVLLIAMPVLIFLILTPPLPQDQSYHAFADRRTLLGIPNFWNVVSNLPFAVVGLVGLLTFRDLAARVVFFGFFATAFGSAYYHLNPNDARLFWDRLPMTVAFMSIFAIAIKQRRLVAPLVLAGIASIVWWRFTNNLWPYGLVQFGTLATLVVIAFRSEPGLWPVIGWYGLSKVAEHFDTQIYALFPLSGHTLKHLFAGIGAWYVVRWLRPLESIPSWPSADG